MRYAELNLLVTMLLGKAVPGIGTWPAPWPADWIKPVQVWTAATVASVEIGRDRPATVVYRPKMGGDRELTTFADTLRKHRVRVLKISETPPLQGFHYHGLAVSAGDQERIPVEPYLRQRCMGQVRCVDASVLQEIGCRPPTETAMAAALRLASAIDRPYV